MSIMIVTYDLMNPGQNYEALLKRIREYQKWAKLGYSTFLIATEQTPVQVRDYLGQAIDRYDKLYVGVAVAPAAWQGMTDEVSNWIRSNLK